MFAHREFHLKRKAFMTIVSKNVNLMFHFYFKQLLKTLKLFGDWFVNSISRRRYFVMNFCVLYFLFYNNLFLFCSTKILANLFLDLALTWNQNILVKTRVGDQTEEIWGNSGTDKKYRIRRISNLRHFDRLRLSAKALLLSVFSIKITIAWSPIPLKPVQPQARWS